MAAVATTLNITGTSPYMRTFPFTGERKPDQPLREIICTLLSAQVALTGAGDNQLVYINIELPPAKAYRCVQALVQLRATVAGTFGFQAALGGLYQNDETAPTVRIPIEFQSSALAMINVDIESRFYSATTDLPRVILAPATPAGQNFLQLSAYNNTANDTAYLVNFYARFFEYEPGMVHEWAINQLQPVC
jgi:hypothetical protein